MMLNIETRKKGHLHHEIVIVLGEVQFQEGRDYPWLGKCGSTCEYFESYEDAVEFSIEGIKKGVIQ